MNESAQRIKEHLLPFYPPEEWPCLLAQAEEWGVTRPLEGLRILDATPLYRNTLGKFMALLAAGADVYVPWRSALPSDPAVKALLPQFGIRTATKGDDFFDIILDCAGQFNRLKPTLGACELTRTGVARYERAHFPVFLADSSRIKCLETMLGTGESFFRAMDKLGYGNVAGRRLVVVGYGKVGRGVVYYALKRGMRVTVADMDDKRPELPTGVDFVSALDADAFNDAVLHAWCVVTATGHVSALRRKLRAAEVSNSPVLLANLGAEDEFGPEFAETRVLARKKPINFILDDPTRMRYIETTMALHNACALELLTQDLPHKGLHPSEDVEGRLLAIARDRGLIADEIADILSMS